MVEQAVLLEPGDDRSSGTRRGIAENSPLAFDHVRHHKPKMLTFSKAMTLAHA